MSSKSIRVSTILEAAESGDRLAELWAMRRRIAKTLDDPNCPPKDISSLSRRQLEIGREIDTLLEREASEVTVSTDDEPFDPSSV